jgi:hypothetical protein
MLTVVLKDVLLQYWLEVSFFTTMKKVSKGHKNDIT